ncbi:uncharacterized protein EURHEDRAFT_378962 [Aspergillus ruber CBS 135680]|uniref:Extracellular membrane protein CFEM domain-containing protein n=1 Tax=Aspergillus ruber (strain CBS 135680) TaxID=1388766 RepID=A0A017SAG5_ASPRC|nr:uncharacterized protein EURHEDRAFT_378962 [Aspergillus ruber CBS 135680]EYE93614.1 hypothetical protein EURHEDRAFT_378962 [Aspergillus ruber CBS 135680]
MKLTLLILSSLLTLALSQEIYPSVSERDSCVARCNTGDFCCVTQCHDLLCGNIYNTNDAIRCMTGCPIGVGTPEQVVALSRCREDCILNNYSSSSTWTSASSTSTASSTYSSTSTYSSSTSTSTSTGAASTATSSPASAETSSSSTSTSTSTTIITPTATGSGSEPEKTSNVAAVNNLRFGALATGFVGFLLAFLV